jgi:hypothetical protein
MYLTGRRFLSNYFNKGDSVIAAQISELFPEHTGKQGRWGEDSLVKEVRIEAGYWRKANSIHKWFVDNVQGGKDECVPHHVSRDQLKELRAVCQRVLAFRHLAVECLPVAEGFFFGNTDYDEHYFQDLEITVKIIDECLALPDQWEFEYCSSW